MKVLIIIMVDDSFSFREAIENRLQKDYSTDIENMSI